MRTVTSVLKEIIRMMNKMDIGKFTEDVKDESERSYKNSHKEFIKNMKIGN